MKMALRKPPPQAERFLIMEAAAPLVCEPVAAPVPGYSNLGAFWGHSQEYVRTAASVDSSVDWLCVKFTTAPVKVW